MCWVHILSLNAACLRQHFVCLGGDFRKSAKCSQDYEWASKKQGYKAPFPGKMVKALCHMTADPVPSGAKVFSFGQGNSQTFSTNNLPWDHQRVTLLGGNDSVFENVESRLQKQTWRGWKRWRRRTIKLLHLPEHKALVQRYSVLVAIVA